MKKKKGDQEVTLDEYVNAICNWFRGQKDPLEELKDFRLRLFFEKWFPGNQFSNFPVFVCY